MMGQLLCFGVVLTIMLTTPFSAWAQEPYRLLQYRDVTVVSLEGPAPSSGGGPGSDGLVYSYARNYATVLTIDGELFVNGEYYGRVLIDNPVSVVLASGRVFVDGIRRPSQPYPDGVADRFFGKTENAKVDWTPIMGWPVKAKVLVRDSRIAIGGGGRLDRGVGPYVLGMNQDGAFFVWGIPYGPIQEGDTVEVYRDRVLVNGKVRPPTSVPPKK